MKERICFLIRASSLVNMEITAKHYLYPSAIFASKTPTQVTTVLGTCVAVCLFDPFTNIGGINHFMLPLWKGEGLASPKYGDIAIDRLLQKMLSLGAGRSNLQAKMFGGVSRAADSSVYNIGGRNIQLAHIYLDQLGIPVLAKHVGGDLPRKVLFSTHTGEVLMKVLKKEEPSLRQAYKP
jgi:chemotaxis protein CheD